MFSCLCQSEEGESCVYWPGKDQPISFEGFTVSYLGEEHLCLSNDERLLVQDFTVESPQVIHTHTHTHTHLKTLVLSVSHTSIPVFSLRPSRTITCWRCVSTAPPAGPTQTVPSETVLIWSTQSESTADIQTDLQSFMIREYNTDRLTPSFDILLFLCDSKLMCVCVCVAWEVLHQGCSVPSLPCPVS